MGAKGEIKQSPITWEYILSVTSGGWDVFFIEIGKFPVSRAFPSPLRRDRHPSFTIFSRDNIWMYKDFSNDDAGDALKFVKKKYSLSNREAIDKICQDLGISQTTREYRPIQIIDKAPIYEPSEIHIGFSEKKWRKEHYQFWEGTDVDEQHARKYNTFAVKELAINRRRVRIGDNEVVFAYYAEDIDKVKIYFPEREKGEKFRGNVPNNYLWNINNIGHCNKLVLIKSMKDLLCTSIFTECVIATQNESAKITMSVADQINNLADNIWVAFGSDPQGVEQSVILTQEYGWNWVNPPKSLLPDINDPYSLEKRFGRDAWKECLINKGVI